MEDDSDFSFAPNSSPSTSVSSISLTDTRLSDITAADGSATTSSSATVATAVSIALTSSTSQGLDSSTPSIESVKKCGQLGKRVGESFYGTLARNM